MLSVESNDNMTLGDLQSFQWHLKVVSESRVTWATSVPMLVFLGLSVLELGLMYATDVRQTYIRKKASLNASTLRGRRHSNPITLTVTWMNYTLQS